MDNKKTLKAGAWYSISVIICKGMGFFVVPFLTRIMGQHFYGLYSDYLSILGVVSVIVTMNFSASFIRARYDYSNSFEDYVFSVTIFSIVFSLGFALLSLILYFVLPVNNLLILKFILFMFLNIIFITIVDNYQNRNLILFNYKINSVVSILLSFLLFVLPILFSITFVDKLSAVILANICTYGIIAIFVVITYIKKCASLNRKYLCYAIPICFPYVPHLLSLIILNASDKIMITSMVGPEENALYSVAYSCGSIVMIIGMAINNAFAPWLGERLHNKEYDDINGISDIYLKLFSFVPLGIMIIGYELLWLLGGESFFTVVNLIPLIAMGNYFQFVYTMYVNIEQYEKKTKPMAVASAIAAILNIVLNFVFIPIFGYFAAAWTTMFCYLFLLVMHMIVVYKMDMIKVYSVKKQVIYIVFVFSCAFLVLLSYQHIMLRIILGVSFVLLFFAILYRYRYVFNIKK